MAAVMMAYPPRDSFQEYPHQYAVFQTRAHQAQSNNAQSLAINPYANYAPVAEAQQYVPTQSSSLQATQVAVGDDGSRPSLPPISNLLDLADGDRTNQDGTHQSQAPAHNTHQFAPQPPQNTHSEQRQQASYGVQDYQAIQQRMATVPPTPPLRNDSVVEGTHSPSTISTGSSLSIAQPYYMASALNNIEATDQRSVTNNQFIKRHSLPSQPNISPYGAYSTSPYTGHSPGTASTGSYYSPSDASHFYPNQQRSLPSNFPPQPPTGPHHHHQHHPSSPPKLWQHHHYINTSSTASFPQSQDRYICQTCAKAFSRPSSLKIHTHSHTGEKPFKCPRAGCGKSFSVRSNMKRHERGCHGANGGGMMGLM